jgi:hypothetical protein
MEKYKTVLEKKEQYIQFSEEEIKELGWKENQKISIELTDNGIMIKPLVSVEIDMSNWSKEILLFLIEESCKSDKSINEVISEILEKMLCSKKECYEL